MVRLTSKQFQIMLSKETNIYTMAKSRRKIAQGKKVRAAQLEKAAIAAFEANEVEFVETVDMAHFEVAQQNTEASPISWSNATKETEQQKFKRKLTYARETISRKRSALTKAAEGSHTLDRYFTSAEKVTPPEPEKAVIPRPRRPDNAIQQKILITLPIIEAKLRVSKNTTSEQYQEGVDQYLKYLVVREMMLLLQQGETFVDASKHAVAKFWFDVSKFYRPRVARKWLNMVLDTGDLPLHQQGKHAKRTSILSDPDVKERCMAWLRLQKSTFRSIPALRRFIRQEVFPELLELSADVEADDAIATQIEHPLSNDALSTYLKSWGFTFKKGKDIK